MNIDPPFSVRIIIYILEGIIYSVESRHFRLGMLVGDSPTGEFLFTGEFTGGFTATPGEFTGHYSKFILDKMDF
jgi:hypothetical protein